MQIGSLKLEIYLPMCGSLKEKRRILNSLKDSIRRNFNVAISEVDCFDLWQKSTLGISTVGGERRNVERTLRSVIDFLAKHRMVKIINEEIDVL